MHTLDFLTRGLATVFLAGPWEATSMVERGARALGKRPKWLRRLAENILERYSKSHPPTLTRLSHFIGSDAGFFRACERGTLTLTTLLASPYFAPGRWTLPKIQTVAQLADWLGVSVNDLDWFADRCWLEAKTPSGKLRHYQYRWLRKSHGRARLIESPKFRLKVIQRRILHEILDHIPPHEAAHGFRAGRSIRSFASPHAGRQVALKIDLTDYFPTIEYRRVMGLFMTAGYPEQVARQLAALCCNVTPEDVWEACPADRQQAFVARTVYRRPHLPQGAPTSPALANLCTYRLDCRLAGLARAAGATYTRYADDLLFSGDALFTRSVKRFYLHVVAVALDEGFRVHLHKTRIMRQGVRQRAAGVVLNVVPNVPRDEFDTLKAMLHNAVKFGPVSQNRKQHPDFRAYLAGRVSFVEMLNPPRGLKLRRMFDAITW